MSGALPRRASRGDRSDDALTADFRVFQRIGGHRYALDDVLTAWTAARRAKSAARVLDLGSGIGSVALMLAWKLPEARLTTVEAQAVSSALQRENVARNGVRERFTLVEGDLREPRVREQLGSGYDLVTGTPPYFPAGTALASPDPQRAYARVELRGGIEAYLEAAASLAREGGVIVVCAAASRPERVLEVAPALGLHVEHELVVSPREGKPALFTVWTLARGAGGRERRREAFVARTREGARTEAERGVRAFFGLAREQDEASPTRRERAGARA